MDFRGQLTASYNLKLRKTNQVIFPMLLLWLMPSFISSCDWINIFFSLLACIFYREIESSFPIYLSSIPFGGGWEDNTMYKGLKRVREGGLERGLSRALKVANSEYIFVFEVMKQRLLTQCLFFGDTGKVTNVFTKYSNTFTLLAVKYKIE